MRYENSTILQHNSHPVFRFQCTVIVSFVLLTIPACDEFVPVSVTVTDNLKRPISGALIRVQGEDFDDKYVDRTQLRTNEAGKAKGGFTGHTGGHKGLQISANGFISQRKRVKCRKVGIDEHVILEKDEK